MNGLSGVLFDHYSYKEKVICLEMEWYVGTCGAANYLKDPMYLKSYEFETRLIVYSRSLVRKS